MSPARVLGPAIVFNCHWDTAWVYILGGKCFVPVADHQSYSPVLFLTIHFAAHERNMQRRKGCRLFGWGRIAQGGTADYPQGCQAWPCSACLPYNPLASDAGPMPAACILTNGPLQTSVEGKTCISSGTGATLQQNAKFAKFQQQSCSALITSCFADILSLNKCCKVACLQKHPYIHICELVQACRRELCSCSQPMNLKATCECLQTWLGAL